MNINIESAQNGFVVRDGSGADPVVVADFGQLINVLIQAFNVQINPDGTSETGEAASDVNAPEDTPAVGDDSDDSDDSSDDDSDDSKED